jgi:membrane fusion protein
MEARICEERHLIPTAKVPLFRPEANSRQAPQLYGDILFIRPLSLTILLWILLCFFLLLGCLLTFGHYTSKTHVTGILLPDRGILKVFTLQGGTLVECYARNGQRVNKGEALFLLASDRSTTGTRSVSVESQRQFLSRRQSLVDERSLGVLLNANQAEDLHDRLQKLHQQEAALVQEITSTNTQLKLDKEAVERYRQLKLENLISVLDLGERERAPLEREKALAELQRSQIALAQEKRDLELQLERLPLQLRVQNAPLVRSISELDSQLNELDANHRAVVRAPADGTLASVIDHVGMNVDPNSALAALVPRGSQLEAYLYAPGSALGSVRSGETVLLRYRAYPWEKFGQQEANLTEISPVAISPAEYALRTGLSAQEPMYQMIAKLSSSSLSEFGRKHELLPGMELEADILLEQRSLRDWLFEPVFAAKGGIAR